MYSEFVSILSLIRAERYMDMLSGQGNLLYCSSHLLKENQKMKNVKTYLFTSYCWLLLPPNNEMNIEPQKKSNWNSCWLFSEVHKNSSKQTFYYHHLDQTINDSNDSCCSCVRSFLYIKKIVFFQIQLINWATPKFNCFYVLQN